MDPIRDLGFIAWKDPDAWIESMKGTNWNALLKEEDSYKQRISKLPSVKDNLELYKETFQEIQALANNTAFPATIASLTITTTGKPVQLAFSVDCNFTVQAAWVRLQFYRDSSTIGQIVQAEPGATSGANANSPVCLTYIDTPAAGSYTYTCRAVSGAYAGGDFKFGEAAGPTFYAVELASAVGPTGPVNAGYICQSYISTNQVVAAGADTLVSIDCTSVSMFN